MEWEIETGDLSFTEGSLRAWQNSVSNSNYIIVPTKYIRLRHVPHRHQQNTAAGARTEIGRETCQTEIQRYDRLSCKDCQTGRL